MAKRKAKSALGDKVQVFGRSLLLPIALLAPIGMIMGISNALSQSYMIEKFPFLSNEIIKAFIGSSKSITSVIFNNIPLLFAMGVAYGVSKKEKGIAVFSSVVSYMTLLVAMNVALTLSGTLDPENASQGLVLGIQTIRLEAFGGIVAGLIAAVCADRFYRLELPMAFAFFGGKKSVPIISFMVTIPFGLIIPSIWNIFTNIMISLSFIFTNDYVGSGVYMALNRALIPFGLHHVLSSMVRFTEAGGTYMIDGETFTGILNATNKILFDLGPAHESWSLMPKLTSYLGGSQMLTTLFRIPAIALAMYHTSYKQNKPIIKGMLITIVLTAFLGNITEPMEFSFLFISPVLYGVYCLLAGLMTIPYALMGIAIGYIRGTIFDFAIFGLMYDNTRWPMLILLGAINFAVFYFVFKFLIIKWNLDTPGREEELVVVDNNLLKEKRYPDIARMVIEGLGGKQNMTSVENCVTRLRVDLVNPELVNREVLKQAGAAGIFFPQEKHIHVVFGTHVEFVRNAVDDEMNH